MISARRNSARTGRSLSRSSGFRAPRKTVMVLCEGKRTEPEYIYALSRENDVKEVAAVRIIIDRSSFGCAPMTLVRRAVELRKRSEDEHDEIDEIWCVFDVEWSGLGQHHPNLHEAIQTAEASGVHCAISNPSFELWLILHFRNHTGFLANADARRMRAEYDGSAGKEVDGAIYMPRRSVAARQAKLLDERHALDGTRFPQNNPSSGMHLLLTSVTNQLDLQDGT